MGVILDVISGQNLIAVVTDNIPKAIDLTGMGVTQFFAAVQKKAGSNKISILRIWGHGVTHYNDQFQTPYNKGNLKIGDDRIDADSVGSYEGSLKVITKLFEPKTWVPPVFSARPNGTKPLPSAAIVEYNDKSLKR